MAATRSALELLRLPERQFRAWIREHRRDLFESLRDRFPGFKRGRRFRASPELGRRWLAFANHELRDHNSRVEAGVTHGPLAQCAAELVRATALRRPRLLLTIGAVEVEMVLSDEFTCFARAPSFARPGIFNTVPQDVVLSCEWRWAAPEPRGEREATQH